MASGGMTVLLTGQGPGGAQAVLQGLTGGGDGCRSGWCMQAGGGGGRCGWPGWGAGAGGPQAGARQPRQGAGAAQAGG